MPETLYQKIYRKNHPDKEREKCKRWRLNHPDYKQKLRLKVLIHYSGTPPHCQCPKCNEREIKFLTIDHINNNGAEHRKTLNLKSRSSGDIYHWLIKNNFPEGFQVLCYNCNCGKARNNGVCPHINSVKT